MPWILNVAAILLTVYNDAQEAKPYKQDPEIVSMTNLVASFQRNDINEFEKILRTNK